MSDDQHSRPMRHHLWAQQQRESENYGSAGMFYSTAAFGWFSRIRHLPEELPDGRDETYRLPKYLAWGVQELLAAGLCFRIQNEVRRGKRRSEIGISLVEDSMEHEQYFEKEKNSPRIGLGYEMIGDLRLFGSIDSHNESYEQAKSYYSGSDSDIGWQGEPEFSAIINILIELADSTDHKIGMEKKDEICRSSLMERIEYKQEYYVNIISRVIESGGWESDTF